MRLWKFIVLSLVMGGLWAAGISQAAPEPFSDDQIMTLFFEKGPYLGTDVVYRVATKSRPADKSFIKIGDVIGSYRVLREESSYDGPGLRLASSNKEVVVRAQDPRAVFMNECWVAVPGLSAYVECLETNISLDGVASARILITNAGPQTVEFSGSGFSGLLYQGSDAEENLRGFRAGEYGWRGAGKRVVLEPGATHEQDRFEFDLAEPYLPSALVVGPATLQATLHLEMDGQVADLACRDAQLQLYETDIRQSEPKLRVEKTGYALGETVRYQFWGETRGIRLIPEEYWDDCYLNVVKPDGSREKSVVGWPSSTMLFSGCSGELWWEWENGDVPVGTYVLAFEFAGKTTPPVELVVRELEVLKDIQAEFIVGKRGEVGTGKGISASLRVENRSSHVIRFALPRGYTLPICLRVTGPDPGTGDERFESLRGLSGSVGRTPEEPSAWTHLYRSYATLQPGEAYELELDLANGHHFKVPGEYEVELAMTIPLTIGEPDGEYGDVCPVRIPIRSRKTILIQ